MITTSFVLNLVIYRGSQRVELGNVSQFMLSRMCSVLSRSNFYRSNGRPTLCKIDSTMKAPITSICDLSFPAPRVLLVSLNKPEYLNCLSHSAHIELENVWNWMDDNSDLLVGIITGSGRAFCCGAELKGSPPKAKLLDCYGEDIRTFTD
jgi:Enoyl-CoA hydratase/isomerase